MDLRLGFLASHGGSNVEAILNNISNGSLDAESIVVISQLSKLSFRAQEPASRYPLLRSVGTSS